MSTVGQLFARSFQRSRDPRSQEYRAGVLAALRLRLGETAHVVCPYAVGTAQADAWISATDEGHALARAHLEASSLAWSTDPDAATRQAVQWGRELT